jgi:hypothetical protein
VGMFALISLSSMANAMGSDLAFVQGEFACLSFLCPLCGFRVLSLTLDLVVTLRCAFLMYWPFNGSANSLFGAP